jgi:hypothetical protein
MVYDVTATEDRVCQVVTVYDQNADLEETVPPAATSDRVCGPIDDRLSLGGTCKNGAACVDSHPDDGVSCTCVDGWSDTSCDCKSGETYSINIAFVSSCFAISDVCGDGKYEHAAPTDFSNRICRDITECGDGYYEAEAPTATSDRVCIEHAAECGGKYGTIEVPEPTAFQDPVCANTTSTTTVTATATATSITATATSTTATATDTTTTVGIVYACNLMIPC